MNFYVCDSWQEANKWFGWRSLVDSTCENKGTGGATEMENVAISNT